MNIITKKKKISLLSTINSCEAALEVVQQSTVFFAGLGIYQLILGLKYFPSLRFSAMILIALALLLGFWKSRLAAIMLLILTGALFLTSVLQMLTPTGPEFIFVFITFVFFWLAVKSVEATIKLHGRLALVNDAVKDISTDREMPENTNQV